MTPESKPFPFYYDRLPTYQEAYEALKEKGGILERDTEATWRNICRLNNIYQLWNEEYIGALARVVIELIGCDVALEVCAGDGMLSHWLSEYGVNIRATDNMSWHQQSEIYSNPAYKNHRPIQTHSKVEELDAISAIRKYRPRMVVASWIGYDSELDCEIIDEKPEYLILMGEEPGGCTGSPKFWGEWGWEAYWRQKGYVQRYLGDVDKWNICRSDYPVFYNNGHWKHGRTTLYHA